MSKGRNSVVLPIGYADQVLELQMKMEDEESVEVVQILSKMYKIGVDYYLQNDVRKAAYLQKKLNNLVAQSFNNAASGSAKPAKIRLCRQMREETQKINSFEASYISSWVKQSQKSQKRIKDCVQADLCRQEERFQNRMLQRIKSSGRL